MLTRSQQCFHLHVLTSQRTVGTVFLDINITKDVKVSLVTIDDNVVDCCFFFLALRKNYNALRLAGPSKVNWRRGGLTGSLSYVNPSLHLMTQFAIILRDG